MCVGDGIYEGYHGTLSFPVSKGKYTIVLKRYKFSGETNDNVTIRADYPKASASTAKFNYLTISLKKGDTLWKIAEEHYGKGQGARYTEIVKANTPPVKNPDLIQPGWVLRIPAAS